MYTQTHLQQFQDVLRLILKDCAKPDITPKELIGMTAIAYCFDQRAEVDYGGMALFKISAILHNTHKIMFVSSDQIYLEYCFEESSKGWYFVVDKHRFPTLLPKFEN